MDYYKLFLSLFLLNYMKDKRLEHIHNVIQPRDEDQFIRTFYLNQNWDISNEELEKYLWRVREQAYENWYAEEEFQKVISDAKEIASNLEGLTINL